jgi:hypothetical protein
MLVRKPQLFRSCIQSMSDKVYRILQGDKWVFSKHAIYPFVMIEASDLNRAPVRARQYFSFIKHSTIQGCRHRKTKTHNNRSRFALRRVQVKVALTDHGPESNRLSLNVHK